ncbi:flavin reductase family protein [Atopobacter phocae]|uniref:flavin reductase family protein n=1 Tax=Atopobacter phocae TaxID=136492 RepID=UPI0004712110|nr:flavin reductase family protein [Atopobacter phocae]
MKAVNPNELSERENYKFLVGSVIPRPVAVVSTMGETGIVNVAPFSYFNIVTSNPPILSVSIQRHSNGKMKDTARNILDNKQAVIHILDKGIVEDANQTAASLEPNESELNRTNFHLVDSLNIEVPGLKEARIRFEVELYEHVLIEEAGQPTADLLLLRVLTYHIEENLYHEGRIDPIGLEPISRLAGNNYSQLGEIFSVKRPN